MNVLHLLVVASSTMALLPACTSPGGAKDGRTPWEAAPDRTFGEIAAASAGNEGAIVYAELGKADSHGVIQSVVKLQRLDAAGAARGDAIELGTAESPSSPTLTLATDGAQYLACWDDESESQVSCTFVPVGEGSSRAALSVAGAFPSLAYSSGAWTLAYGVPGHLAVSRLTSAGSAVGSPIMFDMDEDAPPKALLAASDLGFVLVSAPAHGSEQNVRVHQLDMALSPIADPIDLGKKLWIRNAVAMSVNGAKVAASVSEPYGSTLFLLDGSAITSTHWIDGGGKIGAHVALAVDGAAFGRLSLDNSPSTLTYSMIEGEEVTASQQELGADRAFDEHDSTFALLEVNGNLLFAATAGQQLIVAPVHRP